MGQYTKLDSHQIIRRIHFMEILGQKLAIYGLRGHYVVLLAAVVVLEIGVFDSVFTRAITYQRERFFEVVVRDTGKVPNRVIEPDD